MVIPEAAIEAARAAYLSYQRGSAMHNATDAMKAALEAAHPALLALVREQAAQIERVEALADEHDRAADNLLHRAEGYIDGEYKSRHLARADEERARAWAIRAALTATGQP